MVNIQIRLIDVLVHPDFYQMGVPELPLHPRQMELRGKWDARVKQLSGQRDSVMIYFSNQ